MYVSPYKSTRTEFSGGITKFSPLINLIPPSREIDLVPALGLLPTIAGINLAAIGNLLYSIRKCLKLRQPCISGRAVINNGQLIVRLTAQAANGTIKVVSGSSELKSKEDVAIVLAEEVSFKMLYLISKECSVSQSQAASELRKGLEFLDYYISSSEAEGLERARGLFASVRRRNPNFIEAYLYEGIALDLLEEHDKAIEHFEFIRNKEGINKELKERATYNQAISHFRKYNPSEFDKAIILLDELAQDESTISTPIMALALAAKANVIAHKPIFWRSIPNELTEDVINEETSEQKKTRQSHIQDWIDDVKRITDRLEKPDVRGTKNWDRLALVQVDWAATNALGNLYLNCAKAFIGSSDLPSPFSQDDKRVFLDEALSKFEKCEMLLPPGVETLTNLGTTYLELHKHQEAREYFNRAIKLNKNYEYAYYRLAQSWESEDNIDEAGKVLKSFHKLPRIPTFRDIYDKYQIPIPGIKED